MEKESLKAVPLKGKLLRTIKLLAPISLAVLFGKFTSSYIADDPERLERFWETLPEELMILSIVCTIFGIVGILGWYLGDYIQKKK